MPSHGWRLVCVNLIALQHMLDSPCPLVTELHRVCSACSCGCAMLLRPPQIPPTAEPLMLIWIMVALQTEGVELARRDHEPGRFDVVATISAVVHCYTRSFGFCSPLPELRCVPQCAWCWILNRDHDFVLSNHTTQRPDSVQDLVGFLNGLLCSSFQSWKTKRVCLCPVLDARCSMLHVFVLMTTCWISLTITHYSTLVMLWYEVSTKRSSIHKIVCEWTSICLPHVGKWFHWGMHVNGNSANGSSHTWLWMHVLGASMRSSGCEMLVWLRSWCGWCNKFHARSTIGWFLKTQGCICDQPDVQHAFIKSWLLTRGYRACENVRHGGPKWTYLVPERM